MVNSGDISTKEEREILESSADECEGELARLATDSSEHLYNSTIQHAEPELPPETPAWGIKLLEIMQKEFRSVSLTVTVIEESANKNTKNIKDMEKKLSQVELQNWKLVNENFQLRERLLEVEYRQRRNNLIFKGVLDLDNETDAHCITKLRQVLRSVLGLDHSFCIDRCY